MLTVPAQIFCAPTRAALIAALRSMPGVCAVLGSSDEPGITRTPSCFHLVMGLPPVSEAIALLSPLRGAGEAARLLCGAEQGLGLVDAFLLLEARVGIRHDAGAGLHIEHAVLDQRGAQRDAGVHLAGGREIADAAGVEAALLLLQFVDDLHGPHFRRP